MKLKENPETDMEYWLAIEELGGYIYYTNHDLSHGRMKSTPGIEKDMREAGEISQQLVGELFEKFGVVAPNDCPRIEHGKKMPDPPFGFKWYWVWYYEMKEKAHREAYDGIICSACPMSKGFEEYLNYGSIPCGEWNGVLNRLVQPFLCAKVSFSKWTEDKFVEKIVEKGGLKALKAFNAKKRELITKFTEREVGISPKREETDNRVDQALSHIA